MTEAHHPLFKIIEYFVLNPYKQTYIRELARILKLSPFVVKKYVDVLVRKKILLEERKAKMRYIKPNLSNLVFKYIKITYSIYQLVNSGLIDFLVQNIPNVSSIVLFGSLAQGKDTLDSDIDLLVIGKRKSINLIKFEDHLGRTISLHIYSWTEWKKKVKHDPAFYNEVLAYGVPLYGELPIVK